MRHSACFITNSGFTWLGSARRQGTPRVPKKCSSRQLMRATQTRWSAMPACCNGREVRAWRAGFSDMGWKQMDASRADGPSGTLPRYGPILRCRYLAAASVSSCSKHGFEAGVGGRSSNGTESPAKPPEPVFLSGTPRSKAPSIARSAPIGRGWRHPWTPGRRLRGSPWIGHGSGRPAAAARSCPWSR